MIEHVENGDGKGLQYDGEECINISHSLQLYGIV